MQYPLTSKQYNEALKQDKLIGLRCQQCGTINAPPRMVCIQCTSPNLQTVDLRGEGKIVTFTTVFVAPEGREKEVPYVIVMVELDEGPWITGNLEGIEPHEASMDLIGQRVRVGHKVLPGDKYSAGELVVPLFKTKG